MIFESMLEWGNEMSSHPDPDNSLWPENCAGSRKALAIFVGPSPGGKKEVNRRDLKTKETNPLWDAPYIDPLSWRNGFKTSFKPIVEELFGEPYDIAAKFIARFNMDWMSNPESDDVSYRYMWEGCMQILPVLYECKPDLIIPMDEKTFGVLQIGLYQNGYAIIPAKTGEVRINIFKKKKSERFHKKLMAFQATKSSQSYIVIKAWQHPARIYDANYARRIGKSLRIAAEQIANNEIVNINL